MEDIFTDESRRIRTDGTAILGFPEMKEAETFQFSFGGLELGI